MKKMLINKIFFLDECKDASVSSSVYLTSETVKIKKKKDHVGERHVRGELKKKIFWRSAGNHRTTSWIS